MISHLQPIDLHRFGFSTIMIPQKARPLRQADTESLLATNLVNQGFYGIGAAPGELQTIRIRSRDASLLVKQESQPDGIAGADRIDAIPVA